MLSGKLFGLAMLMYGLALLLHVIHTAFGRAALRKIAVVSSAVGVFLQGTGLVVRYVEAGRAELAAAEAARGMTVAGWERFEILMSHPPFTNLYESLVFFSWGFAIAYLYVEIKKRPPLAGIFSNAIMLIAIGLASLLSGREIEPLVPALRSWWLHAHVIFASAGYGGCLIAAILSFLYLIKDGLDTRIIGLVLSLAFAATIVSLAGGGSFLKGEYPMGLVSRQESGVEKTAVVHFNAYDKRGMARGFEEKLKKPAPYTGLLATGSALLFLAAVGAYILRFKWNIGRTGDVLFAAGWAFLSASTISFLANNLSGGPVISSEEELSGYVSSFLESCCGPIARSGDYAVSAGAPLYFGLKANPYDMALFACMWVLASFQLLLVFGRDRIASLLPEAKTLDTGAYELTVFAFPMLTLLIVTGAVWARFAWGRYWGWDPKETWSLITWFVYAFYLHARISRGWAGRRAAIISVAGFAVVIFTYMGVNLGLTGAGLHVYGKG